MGEEKHIFLKRGQTHKHTHTHRHTQTHTHTYMTGLARHDFGNVCEGLEDGKLLFMLSILH